MDSGRLYRVGRDQTNDIVIEHGSVSRHHCELRLQDDGAVLIVDLDSMNGTAVRQNGAWEHIDKATVERDERILLGEIVTTVAALLIRAPKTAQGPVFERPVAAAPAPVQIQRKIPKPTTPAIRHEAARADAARHEAARSENANIMSRLIKSDWARLHRRSRNPKPDRDRDEPSICLPAFVSAAEIAAAEGDPARLMRAPSLRAAPGDPAAPGPQPAGIVLPPREPSLALSAGVVPAAPEDAIAVAPREAPSLLAGPRQGLAASVASSPSLPAPSQRRPLLPRWLPRPSSPEFAKWAVVGSALLLTTGGAFGAYLHYRPGAETQIAAVRTEPRRSDESLRPPRAAEARPAVARPVSKPAPPAAPGDEKKPEVAKPAAPKSAEPATARARPWQRSIEGTPDSTIAAAAPSGDGLCVAGTTSLSGGHEAWIVRTDGEGHVRWQRRPGGPKRDGALAVTASGDGGCVAAGYDNDETRLWIFKLDAKGVLAWSRSVPAGHTGRAVAVVRTRDGGFAVAAHARPAPDKPDRAFVLRLSPKGEIKWSKYAGKGESRAADLRETRDGGFVVAGVGRGRENPRLALWAARLDRTGHTLWDQHYDGPGQPETARIEVARGTEFVIAAAMHGPKPAAGDGDAASTLRLLRISDGGQVIWDRRHSGAARHVAGLVLIKGGMLVGGDAGEGSPELWLGQFDAQGRAVRESRLPAARGDSAAALAELGNGRLVLVGTAALETAARRGAGLTFLDRDRQLAGR
jgi:hypothetical protein